MMQISDIDQGWAQREESALLMCPKVKAPREYLALHSVLQRTTSRDSDCIHVEKVGETDTV